LYQIYYFRKLVPVIFKFKKFDNLHTKHKHTHFLTLNAVI
jgi:hypothetical protein